MCTRKCFRIFCDLTDPGNYLFLGSMTFAESEELDPAMVIQDRLNEGVMDIVQCCAALATCADGLPCSCSCGG